jgi:flagella basal body P-ring formation protein FlgA
MTSFAKWLFAGLSPLLLASRSDAADLPRALAHRVATRLADLWRVPVGDVRLAWGLSSGAAAPEEGAPFRVLGDGAGGWFVVVFHPSDSSAVAVRMRAGVERPVMVAARPLRAGGAIAAGDLREEVRVHWGAPLSDSLVLPGVGWEIRRPVRTGEVVTPPAVTAPPLVVAGEPVRFEWRSGDVEVSVMGIALNSARRGEQVRARLEERPARLTGTATAPGIAALGAGGTR